jgi:hypothetical protein
MMSIRTFAILFTGCLLLSGISLRGQTASETVKDSTKKKNRQLFEMSFGQSKLFISSSRDSLINAEESVVVPTNAILFFAEFRPQKRLRVPVFLSLATGPKQHIVNGILISERASPTIGTGVVCKAFRLDFGEKSALEFEAGPFASFLFDKGGKVRVAPVVAGRFRFLKREDFIMYLGSSYSLGIGAFGLFYGTGYVF